MIEKLNQFTFNYIDQPDELYKVMTATEVKQAFDSRGNELKDKVNEVITRSNTNETSINSLGNSKADKINVYTKTEVDTKFESKDNITINRKLSSTGDFTGTINGLKPIQTDPFISAKVENIELQLAEIAYFKTPEMFGAIGDGIADDTVALNELFNSGGIIIFNKGNYKISNTIYIKSDSAIYGNDATINKTTDGAILNMNSQSDIVINNLNIIQTEDVYGYLFEARNCNNIFINDLYLENTVSTPSDDAPCMWAMYISGANFKINNIRINNYVSGYHADGIHIADMTNLIIDNFNITSGDDCIALNTPKDGNDIVSRNIVITNGFASSKKGDIFRIDSGANGEFSNSCYKDVLIENVICKMNDDGTGRLLRFSDTRLASVSTAKHDNIIVKNILVDGYVRDWVFSMIQSLTNDFCHYGKIVLEGIIAKSYSNVIPAINLIADDIIIKNCDFQGCGNGIALTNASSSFVFNATNSLEIKDSQFNTILSSGKSILEIKGNDILINSNKINDNGVSAGFGISLSNANILRINNNIAPLVDKFINYTTPAVIPSRYSFMNNIYKLLGNNISSLENATSFKVVDFSNLRLFASYVTADASGILKFNSNVNIHLTDQLVVSFRRASTGDIIQAWYDTSVGGFRAVNYTPTQGASFYIQAFV